MPTYNGDFYKNRHAATVYAAETVLSIVQEIIISEINSAVDVGCGVGTWLHVLKEKGAKDILGIDGDWVNMDHLVIPAISFMQHDLNKKIILNKRYDLAISLEVAEHLLPQSAKGFIASLTNMADFVLFSAAIPGQGGTNHINEQWPDYWIALFKEQGYAGLDIIRRQIWNYISIPFIYKQNILLFVKEERIADLKLPCAITEAIPLSIVHPELFLNLPIRESFKLLCKSIQRRIKRETGVNS
ncbi:MAG: methyltransferase domain-containing protein [Bacteroidales bacterium]